jgi:hypothetical protein
MLSGGLWRLLALIFAGTLLASCASGGHNIGEYMPQWAGGPPNNLPPRPGTPEYDTWRQQQDAERARDKSKDPPKPKADGEKKDFSCMALC